MPSGVHPILSSGPNLRDVSEHVDVPPVRLAELLAALSLGIDLGFSQPMEHVLRQCRIALRLADLVELDVDLLELLQRLQPLTERRQFRDLLCLWAHQDSNLDPIGYEPTALTVKLWAPVPGAPSITLP